MTPAEIVNYQIDVAILYMIQMVVNAMASTVVFGILVEALRLLISRRQREKSIEIGTGRGKWLLATVIGVQATFTLLQLPLACSAYILQTKNWHFSGDTLPTTLSNSDSSVPPFIASDFLRGLRTIITHALIIWRAWCLYPYNVWIKLLLFFAMFCLAGISIGELGLRVVAQYSDPEDPISEYTNIVIGARVWTDMAVNLLATLLILRIAWLHRRALLAVSGSRSRSRVSFVLATLIETGLLLWIIQVVVAVLTETYRVADISDPGFIAVNCVSILLSAFIAAHPGLLVIVLHRSETTITTSTATAHSEEKEKDDSRLTTINFAHKTEDETFQSQPAVSTLRSGVSDHPRYEV